MLFQYKLKNSVRVSDYGVWKTDLIEHICIIFHIRITIQMSKFFSLKMRINESSMKCTLIIKTIYLLRQHRDRIYSYMVKIRILSNLFPLLPNWIKDQILTWCTLTYLQQPTAFWNTVVYCRICICAFWWLVVLAYFFVWREYGFFISSIWESRLCSPSP